MRMYRLNQWILIVVIPIILFCLGLFLSIFTSLTYNASTTILPSEVKEYYILPESGALFAKKKIIGEFTAKENNLGAVALRLHNDNPDINIGGRRREDDRIIFRIKEKGQSKWYYEQIYSGGQFHELEHFPFGFEPIPDSKNKHYYFEIVSKRGAQGNALLLIDQAPVIITHYQFNKNELMQDKKLAIYFVIQKIAYAFSHIHFYSTVFIFFLPLFSYFIMIRLFGFGKMMGRLFLKKFYPRKKYTVLERYLQSISFFDLLIFLSFLIDIFFVQSNNNVIIIILLLLFFIKQKNKQAGSQEIFGLAFFFLCLCPFLLALEQNRMAEKTIIWTFLLLILGVIQSIFIYKKYEK